MTVITFEYTDSYRKSSRGGLAFMPHRRHAANETEVLPNPFTISLKDGRASVNLEPNDETWVWMVTENIGDQLDTYFISVPDRDDSIPFNTITKINPSTLPAPYDAVEPVWWAEVREYKRTVGETLTKAEEAINVAGQAIEDGERYRDESRISASDSRAYYHQSRDYAYDAKEHRDEAERQADRATEGPESAQAQAEEARDESVEARNDSQSARDTALEYRDQTRQARDTALEYRDETQSARDTAEQHLNDTATARDATEQVQTEVEAALDGMITGATVDGDNLLFDTVSGNTINAGNVRGNPGKDGEDAVIEISDWYAINYLNDWEDYQSTRKFAVSQTPIGLQFTGLIKPSPENESTIGELPGDVQPPNRTTQFPAHTDTGEVITFTVTSDGTLRVIGDVDQYDWISTTAIIPNRSTP